MWDGKSNAKVTPIESHMVEHHALPHDFFAFIYIYIYIDWWLIMEAIECHMDS